MRFVSTRGSAPVLGFRDVLLAGLARDGGLYVPEEWPTISGVDATDYPAAALAVIEPYVGGEIASAELARLVREAYAVFRDPRVAPLVEIGPDRYLLELFHGPTLAFKDVALQLVGRLFDHVLAERGERITVVGATSGDTGSAAIDGVRRCANVEVVMLYPRGRVSEVQRRQMTTIDASNVRCVAIDGSFDDCQDLVKAMFNDAEFRDAHHLAAVNSINWARVMAQVVYYATARAALGRRCSFSVPTGNFGNVLAGWIARRTGVDTGRLIVASNVNDILTRFLETLTMSIVGVTPTLSPSMDIQVSSNFERLLFEMNDRDGATTATQMERFRTTGELTVTPAQHERWLGGAFAAHRVDDETTLATIARVHRETGILIDPHTAVGVAAAEARADSGETIVTLATAHPAKFPDAVERATGVRPALPAHLADLFDLPEHFVELPNDLGVVQRFVAERP